MRVPLALVLALAACNPDRRAFATLLAGAAANASATVAGDAGRPSRCLPLVSKDCGCVYSCGVGEEVAPGRFSVRHTHWSNTPLNAYVDRWCVGDACTEAFFVDLVCGMICAPRAADPTCHFEGTACVGEVRR